jgi:hypothetical protein
MVYVCAMATSQAMRQLTANMALNRPVSKGSLSILLKLHISFYLKAIMTTAYINK